MNDKSLREQELVFTKHINTLKKRLAEKDIQAETFTDEILQLRKRTDAQKTRHEELKSTMTVKDSELEDMVAK